MSMNLRPKNKIPTTEKLKSSSSRPGTPNSPSTPNSATFDIVYQINEDNKLSSDDITSTLRNRLAEIEFENGKLGDEVTDLKSS